MHGPSQRAANTGGLDGKPVRTDDAQIVVLAGEKGGEVSCGDVRVITANGVEHLVVRR